MRRRSERSWNPRELFYRYNISEGFSVTLEINNNEIRITARPNPTTNDRENIGFFMSGTNIEGQIDLLQFGRDKINSFQESMSRGGSYIPKLNDNLISRIKLPEDIKNYLLNLILIDPIGKRQMSEMEDEFSDIKLHGKHIDSLDALKKIYSESMQNWELFNYFDTRSGSENRTAFMYPTGPIYIDNLGDGEKFGFSALALAHNRQDTAILWEEIETHQHPSSLRNLIEQLVGIAISNNLQLFISTHSPDALRYFHMFSPEVKLFSLEKDEKNDVVYANDEENVLNAFQNIGWDIENILKYEKMVVFDGLEDEIIINDFYQKIRGHSLKSEGIVMLPVRGNGNKFMEIVRMFSLSSKDFIVLKDLDDKKSKDEVKELVLSWIRTLESEGVHIEEDGNEIKLIHRTSGKQSIIKKSNILIAGNSEKFPKFKTYSISDYLLEILLDNPEILSKLETVKGIDYSLEVDKSKQVLLNMLGYYNLEMVKKILQFIEVEKIPKSIQDDILQSLISLVHEA
jgi:hypothetical protein